jgi:hypothetical protein
LLAPALGRCGRNMGGGWGRARAVVEGAAAQPNARCHSLVLRLRARRSGGGVALACKQHLATRVAGRRTRRERRWEAPGLRPTMSSCPPALHLGAVRFRQPSAEPMWQLCVAAKRAWRLPRDGAR